MQIRDQTQDLIWETLEILTGIPENRDLGP